jgi:hypothetical protein
VAKSQTCDVCGKPCDYVDAKLHFIPAGDGRRITHSDYTHHADVGPCCSERILELFKFQKRTTREEYNKRRKPGKKVPA